MRCHFKTSSFKCSQFAGTNCSDGKLGLHFCISTRTCFLNFPFIYTYFRCSLIFSSFQWWRRTHWSHANNYHLRWLQQSPGMLHPDASKGLDKKPAQIILHVGTNDISEKEPSKIVDGIKEICDIIQNDSPLTEIVISEIILRTDKPEYQQKVSETNSMLADFCESRNIYSISHNNIGKAHINPYGVHLNRAGTSALAKSILVFLNTDRNN